MLCSLSFNSVPIPVTSLYDFMVGSRKVPELINLYRSHNLHTVQEDKYMMSFAHSWGTQGFRLMMYNLLKAYFLMVFQMHGFSFTLFLLVCWVDLANWWIYLANVSLILLNFWITHFCHMLNNHPRRGAGEKVEKEERKQERGTEKIEGEFV